MARPLDIVVKDADGFVRVGNGRGAVLFRVLASPTGPMVHIRLKHNSHQVWQRGAPDFYIPWDEFKAEVERQP